MEATASNQSRVPNVDEWMDGYLVFLQRLPFIYLFLILPLMIQTQKTAGAWRMVSGARQKWLDY